MSEVCGQLAGRGVALIGFFGWARIIRLRGWAGMEYGECGWWNACHMMGWVDVRYLLSRRGGV